MKTLAKVIKDAVEANKYKAGTKEVLQSVKSSKLIVVSKSLDAAERAKLDEQAKSASVTVYEFNGTSMQLGRLCNKPFRVAAIALKSATADEIKAILAEKGSAK
ncbi:MAG: 50S ribosomal protein L7ae [Nitrososphaera sp.]|jgi:large subunit ribosomal protein L30e|nr:50S ribosomal protein L7ae [Nitrososphaera sp.]